MSASILDAIQDLATPAMIKAATSTLGVSEAAATTALAAASTSILGGLIQKSGEGAVMGKVASLAGGLTPDANMFANAASFLTGGLPSSPVHTMGNQLLGLAFGDKTSTMISAVAAATGVNAKAASGLTTLAAPMVLAALRNKLGAAPTATGLASILTADKSLIASAMPASLRTMYGMSGLVASAVPAAAAAASAAAPVAAAVVKAPVASAPVVSTPVASAPVASTTPTPTAAPVATVPAPSVIAPSVIAPAVVAAKVAPLVDATRPLATSVVTAAAPSVQTSSGYATAPAIAAAPVASATTGPAIVRPATAAVAAAETAVEVSKGGLGLLPILAIALPLAILTGLIWYWAYGLDGGKSAVSAAKSVVPPQVAAPAAPKPAPVAAAPVAPAPPAAAPVAAAPASTALVAVPGANGMVKYTLLNGNVIEVSKDGLESKMLAFIGNKDAAIDNKLWFDFDRLSFVTASSELTSESKAQVIAAVEILKAFPAVSVKLGGYTDNQGDPDANTKLSETRAKRVMDEMIADGIAADRLEAKGYGDQFPIADNATPEGRAKNRRTSLSIRSK